MSASEILAVAWPVGLTTITLAVAVAATVHALLHAEHSRAAVGWVGLIWLAPFVGAALYALLGVNRIQRKALRLRGPAPTLGLVADRPAGCAPEDATLPDLARAVCAITRLPLTAGNRVRMLRNGDEAYPEMLAAIAGAQHSVSLCTYIFDMHRWGRRFVDALHEAKARGVDVRVLVDGVGAFYSLPAPVRLLRRRGIDARRFLFSLAPWRMTYLNLRNHRKILVVDGRVGFTGGMNIRDHHVLAENPRQPTADLHFRVEGPVVAQLQEVFALDWAFAGGPPLEGPAWFPDLDPVGSVHARAIPDGPDEDLEAAQWTLIAALSCATRSVRVVTPYFLPEDELVGVLNATALRGVEVDVVLPLRNNLAYLTWATAAELHRLLAWGVRVWLTPGPFDHSKLVVVDERWVLFGSANVDPRSLRLNFELMVEAYDEALGRECDALVRSRIATARRVTLEEIRRRPLLVKLRDGIARLFKPYL